MNLMVSRYTIITYLIGPEIADYLHGSSRVCDGWGLDPIGELTIEPSPSSDKYPAGDLKNMFSKSEKNAESFNLTLLGVDTVDRDH